MTQEDEIHMNERTKFEGPDEEEIDFDVKHEEKPEVDATPFSVEDLLQWKNNMLINTSSRITFNGPEELIQAKGKTLTKREAALTDNTGTIHFSVMGRGYRESYKRFFVSSEQSCCEAFSGEEICHTQHKIKHHAH